LKRFSEPVFESDIDTGQTEITELRSARELTAPEELTVPLV
jgi:hypothetical protein